ncbi:hypothetical protein Tco_0770450 [Tanacetum coccineum]|uniref:Uncharacterized protein n=1 Tax=Tanacetum coccineum TaxID=301880 RepID=A0ABQ4ZC89_9ASTR
MVASDDLRDALSVIFLLFAHSRSVMSIRLNLRVTYTEVSAYFEGLSDIDHRRDDDHEYLELLGMPEDPYAPPSPDYVPGPEHADDEIVAEDASPTAQSPDYVPESDPEADPEEDDDEDPEEDPVDYPADGGDDGDDEEGSSEDDDMDIEADDEEEEEHLAPADSVVVALPATDQAPSAEETEAVSRISIPAPVPTPVWSDAEVARLLAISTPPSSPLSPWSSPLPQIPSPSLPLSPPSPVLSPAPPPSPIRSLGYRAAMNLDERAEPLLFPFSPLLTLHYSPHQTQMPIIKDPHPCPYQSSSAAAAARPARGLRADYDFVATIDREIRRDPKREVGYRITES